MADSKRKTGRPPGKHSNENYAQMTVYIDRNVRNTVKAELAKVEGEFSGLVEGLLREWLKQRGAKLPKTAEVSARKAAK